MKQRTQELEEKANNLSSVISENQFKLINRISAWVVFLIATITYMLTLEPTVSFWDCGEFITSSYKLEVGVFHNVCH